MTPACSEWHSRPIATIRALHLVTSSRSFYGSARAVLTTDPFVTTDQELRPLNEVIVKSDLLILCAPHAAYRQTDLREAPG